MRLSGSRLFRAEPEALWEFLLTPERLRQCLPGCERMEAVGGDTFTASMRLGIGFLKGSYNGTIRVSEQRYPDSLVLAVSGGGALGNLDASGRLTFLKLGAARTDLRYDGQASVGGRIAMVGETLIRSTAERLTGLFFDCMASHVEP
jgi:carbon monoxide dehydrogenase subunit G